MKGYENGGVSSWPTVAAVAKELGLSKASIYRMADTGKLPAHRIGPSGGKIVFDPADVRAYVDGTRTVPRATPVVRRPTSIRVEHDHGF
jgi:excisionase family DNA binding protein